MQVLIFMLFVATVSATNHTCKHEHEHYNECGTDCPITCSNIQNPPQSCSATGAVCYRGCECDEGYYRQFGRYVGGCVLAKDCPPQNKFFEQVIKTGDTNGLSNLTTSSIPIVPENAENSTTTTSKPAARRTMDPKKLRRHHYVADEDEHLRHDLKHIN
ncbi:hypothetical protein JTE90_006177 [Oedothorax gibbosus]|uniref:TIL domain-containing protein n=1 Tax=Oedothorax gibbosus TaxID=931172 RepID=A0AAV6VTS4_9ARAC|nr:hypothetical protein JTE90_006177 [Oedothorax gibbosus]